MHATVQTRQGNDDCKMIPILAKALLDRIHSVIMVRSSGKRCKQFNVCQMFQCLDIWRKNQLYNLGHHKYDTYACYMII